VGPQGQGGGRIGGVAGRQGRTGPEGAGSSEAGGLDDAWGGGAGLGGGCKTGAPQRVAEGAALQAGEVIGDGLNRRWPIRLNAELALWKSSPSVGTYKLPVDGVAPLVGPDAA